MKLLEQPEREIRVRHYSISTEQTYTLREVQDALGLRDIHSAMVYLRCILPLGA